MTAKTCKFLKSLIITSVLVLVPLGLGSALAGRIEAQPSVAREATGANGTAVYQAKCAVCHGKDGRGTAIWKAKGQPDMTVAEWQKSRTDSQIGEIIRSGKGKFMPAWKGKLSEEDVKALVERVRAFGKK